MEQKRFLLALVLSAAVLLVWQSYFAPEPPTDEANGDDAAETQVDDDQDDGDQAEASDQEQGGDGGEDDATGEPDSDADDKGDSEESAEADSDEENAEQNAAAREEGDDEDVEQRDVEVRSDTLKSDRFTLELTNKQAAVTSAKLTEPDQYEEAGDLVGFPDDAEKFPFETSFLHPDSAVPDEIVFEVVEEESERRDEDDGYKKLVYRYDDPRDRFRIDKTFEIAEDRPYSIEMDLEVTNKMSQGTLVDRLALDIYDWKDPDKETSMLDFRPNEVEGVCYNSEDLERETFDKVVDESFAFDAGNTKWGAVDTRYFMLGAIPLDGARSCEMDVVDDDYLRTRLIHEDMSVSADSSKTYSHELFVGPKDVDILKEVGHNISESVDYGMFAFIARPLRWGLSHLYDLVGNWGLAIILLTFIIRGSLTPINLKAYSSMERMKEVQPLIKEVREKYEDDKQRQTEETMKIFRENNVSPAGGCLPMLLQMPILYGLFVMIYNSVELYEADFFLWYTNLAEPDPYYILPILMGVVMFAQQRMSTVDQTNKQAAMMMKIMPVMFTAFMLFLPSGLVLYYALSLLIGVGQQYWVRKKYRGDDEDDS
ncbi:MAG: membrane protein insertase YidC [Persicimonas sp.]